MPHAVLPYCLNALSHAALSIRLGAATPGAAFAAGLAHSLLCLLAILAMDVWSRRAFLHAQRAGRRTSAGGS